jgi:hypothetical protein
MELKPATRLRRLAAALDDVELQTAEDPDGAFILAEALEQEAAELGSEHMQLRAQLVQADVQGRRGQAVASARTLRSINVGPSTTRTCTCWHEATACSASSSPMWGTKPPSSSIR